MNNFASCGDSFGSPLYLPENRKFTVLCWSLNESWHPDFCSRIEAELRDESDDEFHHFVVWFHRDGFKQGLVTPEPRSLHLAAREQIWNFLDENRQVMPESRFARSIHLAVGAPLRLSDFDC